MKSHAEKHLEKIGLSYRLLGHGPVFTVAESMEHLPDVYPVKNLLLVEEKGQRSIFVVMKGDERLDIKRIATEIGTKKLRFAKPELLLNKLGVEPGSASLFSLLHSGSDDVEVVIDHRLLEQKELGFHPGINTQTVMIGGADIDVFMKSIDRTYLLL